MRGRGLRATPLARPECPRALATRPRSHAAERLWPPGAAPRKLRCKKPGVGDASQTQPPHRTLDLRSSTPLLPPPSLSPSLRFSVVAAVTDNCDVGRRELPLLQAASASASPSLAHSRGRRRIYLQGGRASAGEQKRGAQCAQSASTRPAPARARGRGAASAREGGGGAAATRCRGRAGGGARGSGGRRRLCRAGVTEVKYMLTMGSPCSLGRAVGLPPGLALSGSGWTSSWFPSDAFRPPVLWRPECPAVTQEDHFPWPSGVFLSALPVSRQWL